MPTTQLCQFRLRTLIAVVTITAVFLGMVANRLHSQRAAIAAIVGIGATVTFPRCDETAAHPGNARATQLWRRLTRLFATPESVSLRGRHVTDETLALLPPIQGIHSLEVSPVPRVADGVGIRCFTAVVIPDAPAAGITDRGLRCVAELSELTSLDVESPHITDGGVAQLLRCKRLQTLFLRRTSITDAGLRRLGAMKTLRALVLWGADVSDSAVAEIRAALPNCQVLKL